MPSDTTDESVTRGDGSATRNDGSATRVIRRNPRKKSNKVKDQQHTTEPMLQLYIVSMGPTNYVITRMITTIPHWEDLGPYMPSIVYAEETYDIGEVAYISMEGAGREMAQLQKIRALDEIRVLILVSWCYSRKDVRNKCKNASTWPAGCSHMISTHLQVLLWDTMDGKVEDKQLQRISTEKVLDVSTSQRQWRVIPSDQLHELVRNS
jgi:hypothetical protein